MRSEPTNGPILDRRQVLLGALASLGSVGCGMTGYSIRAPFDTTIKTVYVPIFQSITFRRDINFQLTQLVQYEIERRTPYKVVSDEEDADTTLAGSINYTDKNIIVENPNNLPRQLTTMVIVAVTWTDNRLAEKVNTNPDLISQSFNFYPEIGESTEAAFYRTAEKSTLR